MKLRILFEYDKDFAAALGRIYGEKPATRMTVRTWAEALLTATADDILADDEAEAARMTGQFDAPETKGGAR